MRLGIINSAFQQAGVETATGLEHIARIGFDCVDIFTEAVGLPKSEIRLVSRVTARLGLPIISLPVVAVGLIDFNEPVREFHLDRCRQYIDLARTWGAKNVLLVLGEYIWQREVIPPQAQWDWGLETCRRLGDYADKRGIDIDISHLVLSDAGPAEIEKLKGKAIHVHLSDCDGKVHGDLPPGRGVVKFMPYLQAIKELKMNGVVSIELEYAPDPARIVEWVEEAYRETDRLMRLNDLRS